MRIFFLVLGVLLLGPAGFFVGWAVGTNNELAANEKAAQERAAERQPPDWTEWIYPGSVPLGEASASAGRSDDHGGTINESIYFGVVRATPDDFDIVLSYYRTKTGVNELGTGSGGIPVFIAPPPRIGLFSLFGNRPRSTANEDAYGYYFRLADDRQPAAQGPSNTPRQVRVETVGALMKTYTLVLVLSRSEGEAHTHIGMVGLARR